ncbi:MAG: polyribonucleotide nucleotidyltransferase [Chlamydiales bacterium]
MFNPQKVSITIGNTEITFETGTLARQAGGSILLRAGETMILATACAAPEASTEIDFLPLRVDYQEKFSSAGKTLGGFIKREGRPTERETLISRLIDRPLRPMFEDGYYNETQVLAYLYSYDGQNSPEPLAICAASAALVISDIPLIKPVGAVRVGYINGEFIVNPSPQEQQESTLDLMIAGTEDAVLMIEGYCDFLSEEEVIQAIEKGHHAIKEICHLLGNWAKEVGKEKNRSILRKIPQELNDTIETIMKPKIDSIIRIVSKKERESALKELKDEVMSNLFPEGEEEKYNRADAAIAHKKMESFYLRKMILDEGLRSDGRKTNEIRPISIDQGLLPRTHGSVLFTRGETQALAVCTLGGDNMAQRYETIIEEGSRRFYLQYFFPPFSVGEVGRMGPAGRREVGHGKLAERSLQPILPSQEKFPYTIRIESNILESNGSSSMASVCGGCLSLMDAGVPISRAVSGIAMGLILDKERFAILSDILGIEDALGDMDFKVAGDHAGITAFQMDIKVEGITIDIMKAALMQAREGRIHILKKMLEIIPEPSKQLSAYAPRIERLIVKPSKIGTIIGPGGKQIRAIIEETGVEIDINDEGIVSITSPNHASIERAKQIIENLTAEAEIGKVYTGTITSIMKFGVFVEILPGKEGLCHISEYDLSRIETLEKLVKVGDKIEVKVLDIDDNGKIKLSRKATLVRS